MDLNKKRKLLCDIAGLAPKLTHKPESDVNLLDLLNTFDHVLCENNVDAESAEAIDLYKTMLRLGRLNSKVWQARIPELLSTSNPSSGESRQRNSSPRFEGRGSQREFEFLGSFGHSPSNPPRALSEEQAEKGKPDFRTPLTNITNKTAAQQHHTLVHNQRYGPEELPDTTGASVASRGRLHDRIELPKLQISHLLRSRTAVPEALMSAESQHLVPSVSCQSEHRRI